MNITDTKILRYIKFHSRKAPVSNSALKRKFGAECEISIKYLEDNGYIESPPLNNGFQFGFSEGDNWKITTNGLYFLRNYREEQKLTNKQRLIHYFLGFCSGVLTGIIVQLFILLLSSL